MPLPRFELPEEVGELVRSARLIYVRDDDPGYHRVARRGSFLYLTARGRPLRGTALTRIVALAIPPAWTDVWVCADDRGHIQATGRDARGRKQYRYHPGWRAARDGTKFHQLVAFGDALPGLRRRVSEDLGRPGLPREKVLAAVVRLLDHTHMRVGNSEYARHNRSFGLSTLLDRHAVPAGGGLVLRFRGKGGVWHERRVSDKRLAAVVRQCRDLPGQQLFQYHQPGGGRGAVGSADVNGYLREVTGGEFTAKVFRTWAGTVAAAARLADSPPPSSAAGVKRAVLSVLREVAAELGNTPAVCRSSYVHPVVLTAFADGTLHLPRRRKAGLNADEASTLAFLRSAAKS